MPFYHAVVQPGLLPAAERALFAQDVVEVHCRVTGAPPSFVHVLVTEDEGGRLPEGRNGSVTGTIRSGRTTDQRAQIVTGLGAALARRAGVAQESLVVRTRDIDASYTMEGGALLPEPGTAEEEAWKLAGSSGSS